MLSFLWDKLNYGELQPPGNQNANPAPGTFQTFDQLEFFPDDTNWQSRDFKDREEGLIYIPNQCKDQSSSNCRVHFVLHGCNGHGRGFANQGYNDLAITNDIIMVYPETRCWDNHGNIDSQNFKTNEGILNLAFEKMIERLTKDPDEPDL